MTIPFRPRWYFFIALVSITFIGPLSIHLFIPAMPAVKEAFGVSTGITQLTLSLGMLSMACFTIAYGGLSDRFGRKRVLLGGLVLFTCGAAACMVAANMPMLLAGRILQGAGAGCGVVLARAIARDVYGSDRVAQVIAYLTAAYVLGPMLAPPIGGQLTVLFGWRALFVFASAIGLVVILAVAFAVPETRARNVSVPRGVFAGYKSLLRRSRFVGFMLAARTDVREPSSPRPPRPHSSPPNISAPMPPRSACGSSPSRSASWPGVSSQAASAPTVRSNS